jgi:hypothetical protein
MQTGRPRGDKQITPIPIHRIDQQKDDKNLLQAAEFVSRTRELMTRDRDKVWSCFGRQNGARTYILLTKSNKKCTKKYIKIVFFELLVQGKKIL